ncbi:DUF5672 family protein [Pedobacter jejuensis]|uniref:DUF5672 domain-containing protein n=1 Tax=Pedobacter jejuensis TaxID=1268550 RepID=A0A3N0BMA8_9SPHI|nr:DUF5672 family protein [Pedobacter jejuensis]RNL49618.1 hypothetical protein D7004_19590 [Pedobacter jejuensis]
MRNSVTIVIPLYKDSLNALEIISLAQCFKVLGSYNIVAVKPKSLILTNYDYKFKEVYSFDDDYFSDIAGYNRLMLSPVFYEQFLATEFILIYQLDAFIFKDELQEWCNAGYDYIGAPWLREADYPDLFKKMKNQFMAYFHTRYNFKKTNTNIPSDLQFENKVGNGGFSLRNVKKFYHLCLSEAKLIADYTHQNFHRFNEDAFWSVEVNRKSTRLKIPSYKKAAYFAIENNGYYGLKLTKGRIPFGCHAWDKNIEFWRPIFKAEGIEI